MVFNDLRFSKLIMFRSSTPSPKDMIEVINADNKRVFVNVNDVTEIAKSDELTDRKLSGLLVERLLKSKNLIHVPDSATDELIARAGSNKDNAKFYLTALKAAADSGMPITHEETIKEINDRIPAIIAVAREKMSDDVIGTMFNTVRDNSMMVEKSGLALSGIEAALSPESRRNSVVTGIPNIVGHSASR